MTSGVRTEYDSLHIGGTWLPPASGSASASISASTSAGLAGSRALSESSLHTAGRDRP